MQGCRFISTIPPSNRLRGRAAGAARKSLGKTVTLDDLVRSYGQHVFLTASVLDDRSTVSVFGTGRFAGVRHQGAQAAAMEQWLSALCGTNGPDLLVRMRCQSGAAKPCEIALNDVDFAGQGVGPHVVVLDPQAGIAVEALTFEGSNATLWQLCRLVRSGQSG
jgi:hypothetical protein